MKQALLFGWILLPVAYGAYHYGPGQDQVKLDQADGILAEAKRAVEEGEWQDAASLYDEALKQIPAEKPNVIARIRIEKAKAQMRDRQLPEAHADLSALVEALEEEPPSDPALLADARSSLANANFYMCWLMRLEGEPREAWEPVIESSRQAYRLLAEESEARGDVKLRQESLENLDASIKLARMDLSDLQGLPLPGQCKGCCSKKGGKCHGKKPGKKPGEKKPEDSRNAGSGPPPDNAGS